MTLKVKVEGTFETWKDRMAEGRMPEESLKYLLLDWPYLAGIIDGEGCITIAKDTNNNRARKGCVNPSYKLRLSITQNSEWFCNRVKARFGGHVVPKKSRDQRRGEGIFLTGYDTVWQNFRAGWILWNVYPFLVLKREQAKIAFQFLQNLRKTNCQKLTEKDVEIREVLRNRIMSVNGSQRR